MTTTSEFFSSFRRGLGRVSILYIPLSYTRSLSANCYRSDSRCPAEKLVDTIKAAIRVCADELLKYQPAGTQINVVRPLVAYCTSR